MRISHWWNRQWNIPNSFQRRYGQICDLIMQHQLVDVPDRVIWKGTPDGNFSISSAYETIRRKRTKAQWFRLVWYGNTIPWCSFILWLLMHNSLKTRDLVQSRNMNVSGGCLFCQDPVESCNHLFFHCPFSAAIWNQLLAKAGYRRIPQQWRTELNWLRGKASGRSRKARLLRSLLSVGVYYTWSERNGRLFHHGSCSSEELCNKICVCQAFSLMMTLNLGMP